MLNFTPKMVETHDGCK